MIQIDDKLISEDIYSEEFVCNLTKCKGACCVHGDAGAPLEAEETGILKEIYPRVKPFLTQEGIRAIENYGTYAIDPSDGDFVTPLVDGAECAYVTFDDNGITKCGIEKAYEAGEITWQKPISCHLYPIRVSNYRTFSALNYDRWPICSDACTLGKELKVPVFKFLKTPLTRKYGEEFYATLSDAYTAWQEEYGK